MPRHGVVLLAGHDQQRPSTTGSWKKATKSPPERSRSGDSYRAVRVELITAPDVEPLLGGEGPDRGRLLINMGGVDHRCVLREPVSVRFMDHLWLFDPVGGTSEPSSVDGTGENLGEVEAEMTAGFADDPLQPCGRGSQCLGVRADLRRLSNALGADGDLDASQSNFRHSTRFIEFGGNPVWVIRPKPVDKSGRVFYRLAFANGLWSRATPSVAQARDATVPIRRR